jgi:hypothetical protein
MIPYGELDHPEPDQLLDHSSPLQVIDGIGRSSRAAHYGARSPIEPGPVPETSPINVPLPPHLVPVLDQLLRAPTDITASRMLDISPRTFSRRVAELLEHLGVQTRFQGGVTVALSGWVAAARDEDPGDGNEWRTQ